VRRRPRTRSPSLAEVRQPPGPIQAWCRRSRCSRTTPYRAAVSVLTVEGRPVTYPPRSPHQRRRPRIRHPRLDRHLAPKPPTVRLDQNRRQNPQLPREISGANFRRMTLVGEIDRDRRRTLVPNIRQHHRQPRKAAIQLREQLILRCGPCPDSAAPLHRPPDDLGDRRRSSRHRNPLSR
jgi:hypothetical protein